MIEVPKVWGKEIWIANFQEYCGKFLIMNPHSKSSLHYHPKKKETFYCIFGQARLTVNNKVYDLTIDSEPVTIFPGETHRFESGDQTVVFLEVSSFHDDDDVVRIEPSEGRNERD